MVHPSGLWKSWDTALQWPGSAYTRFTKTTCNFSRSWASFVALQKCVAGNLALVSEASVLKIVLPPPQQLVQLLLLGPRGANTVKAANFSHELAAM
mmetsp:Transcript_137876/g.274896  ORF Transcript_137876/g.274896 Transcript_137876/m.274896 type:complete len:96 (+) Transcript_137876:1188-1475(+)